MASSKRDMFNTCEYICIPEEDFSLDIETFGEIQESNLPFEERTVSDKYRFIAGRTFLTEPIDFDDTKETPTLAQRIISNIFGPSAHLDNIGLSCYFSKAAYVVWRFFIIFMVFATISYAFQTNFSDWLVNAPAACSFVFLAMVQVRAIALHIRRWKICQIILIYKPPKNIIYRIDVIILRAAQMIAVSTTARMIFTYLTLRKLDYVIVGGLVIIALTCFLDLLITPAKLTVQAAVLGFAVDCVLSIITIKIFNRAYGQTFEYLSAVMLSVLTSSVFCIVGLVTNKFKNSISAKPSISASSSSELDF